MRAMRKQALCLLGILVSAQAAADVCPATTLEAWAVMPADNFRMGPPAGEFDDTSARGAAPRFPSQPVQGVSSIKPTGVANEWWALSDNGFGNKWNSSDYRLAVYRMRVEPKTRARDLGQVELLTTIELSDPDRRFPYRIVAENSTERMFTGGDIDPESLVVAADGSFWIGDEIGPWLLHFSAAGHLLAAPIELPGDLFSPQHPRVLAGKATATVGASRGIEGLARNADGTRLVAALEAPLATDAASGRGIRLFQYDLTTARFIEGNWFYPLSTGASSLGELAHFGADRYLIIERDNGAGVAAKHKQVHSFRLADTVKDRECIVDLLNIRDRRNLAGYGTKFSLPYWTIESVHAIDERTLVVVNDNNYPATGGRSAADKDSTEWVWIRMAPAQAPSQP
jgi:glycerophosphoryl diester phosphodiesterase